MAKDRRGTVHGGEHFFRGGHLLSDGDVKRVPSPQPFYLARPTADRARRAFDLAEAALDHPPDEREVFLRQVCGDDEAFYEMAHALLATEDDLDTHAVLPGLFEPPVATDLLGQSIGPYTLTHEIGQGGMGTVYLAHRDDLNKEVALKLIRHGRLAAPEHVQRFRLEQRLLARLDHPHIARSCLTPG